MEGTMKVAHRARWLISILIVTLALTFKISAQSSLDPIAEISIGSPIYDMAVSPDGQIIAVAQDQGGLQLFDNTLHFINSLQGHTGRVFSVAWSPDSAHLASAGEDGTIRIWDRNVHNNKIKLFKT